MFLLRRRISHIVGRDGNDVAVSRLVIGPRYTFGHVTVHRLCIFLIGYSAKPLLGHHALVWMVGFRMAGFKVSGSGIRVFVLGSMGFWGWGWMGKSTSQ